MLFIQKISIKRAVRGTIIYKGLRYYYKYFRRPFKDKIKNVLITGVAMGLGRSLAIRYAKSGYKVIGLDIVPEEQLDHAIRDVLNDYIEYDLRNIDGIEELVAGIFMKHQKVDMLINNAGILNFKLIDEYEVGEIKDIVNVNLTSVMVLVKSILPYMAELRFGRIINISSDSAFKGEDKFSIYAPTRAGVMLLSDSVSKLIENKIDSKCSITINSVNPHRIATPAYLAENPDINPAKLISTEKVYNKIQRITSSEVNGGTFPLIKFRLRVLYLLRYFHKLFMN